MRKKAQGKITYFINPPRPLPRVSFPLPLPPPLPLSPPSPLDPACLTGGGRAENKTYLKIVLFLVFQ